MGNDPLKSTPIYTDDRFLRPPQATLDWWGVRHKCKSCKHSSRPSETRIKCDLHAMDCIDATSDSLLCGKTVMHFEPR